MLTDKETELMNEVIHLLNKFGYVGFAGAFREKNDGSFTVLKVEHPLYRDGKSVALGETLEAAITAYWGLKVTPGFSGSWQSGEMPT